jgi:hypothetical protein
VGAGSRQTGVSIVRPEKRRCDDRAETAETAILHAESNGATDGWQYDGHSLPIWGAAFTLGIDRQECLSYFRGCRGKKAWVGSK